MAKDIRTIWNNGGIRSILMLLPIVLAVAFPVVVYVAISLLPEPPLPSLRVLAALGGEAVSSGSWGSPKQIWMEAFTTLLCPLLYLCIPIICAAATASCSFASEKEKHTLETLFLSSVSGRTLFNAKITACSLISILISWISFAAFFITVSILDLLLGAPFFFSAEWLVLSVLLTPALVLFSVVFFTLILSKVHGVGESLQTVGYLLFPLALLYVAQFSGAFRIGLLALIVLAVLFAAASIVLFNISARKFNSEELFTKETLDR